MPLKWKLILIAVVTAWAGFTVYREDIKLGLDLKGGIHLLVEVDTDDAVRATLDEAASRLAQRFDELDLPHDTPVTSDQSVTVSGVPGERMAQARKAANDVLRDLSVEVSGGQLVASLNSASIERIRDRTVQQAMNTIGERIDVYGVSEPVVQRQGQGNRILVQLPGVDDPERVKSLIGKVAFLELKLVEQGPFTSAAEARGEYGGALPSTLEAVSGYGETGAQEWWVVEHLPVVTGQGITSAEAGRDEFGEPVVYFNLNAEAASKFSRVTAANIGRQLAVILDDDVKTAPVINARISNSGVIEGQASFEESQDLALVLRAGALPAKIRYLEERTVGPLLGKESIDSGLRAAVVGLMLVVVFMLIYYRLSGINAVVALVLNMLLMLAALMALKATLTLPGIAGYILTIGMAVDANVIIFERIREDLRAGKAVKSAVESGFAKALSTIFDANITTLIAALLLIQFGTGPIRGFAVTLSLGIVASMFTAIFVSKALFELFFFRGGRSPASFSI